MSVETDFSACYQGYGRLVWIAAAVAQTWRKHRQLDESASESFGVLVGETSANKRELWIEAATSPLALDRRSRFGYKLRDPGHQGFVDNAFEESKGSQIYLGTWHTHPERVPHSSFTDRADWRRSLRRNRKRPLVFVIVGTEEVRVFARWGQMFKALNLRKEMV